VFQIWQKSEQLRQTSKSNLDEFLKSVPQDEADFAMRRVGGRAGRYSKALTIIRTQPTSSRK
jgi:hypothetical protein